MDLPVMPPFRPMLAKAVRELPDRDDVLYEPKWDGFRCLVFRDDDEVELGSRNDRPLTRYFPELLDPLREALPPRCVVDGEVVVVTNDGLDFDALQQRIHPAASRVNRLAAETPASFVAFDLIALGDDDLTSAPFGERRGRLESLLADVHAPIHLCPTTRDRNLASDWFERFEGAGFDGVMAKPLADPYLSDKRAQLKVKHLRTADMVVAGYRRHKDGVGVGSLLLGLYDDEGTLHSVGVASAFTAARRLELVDELAPYEVGALDGHPWQEWADPAAHEGKRMPGGPSRWNAQKDLSFEPLRIELVVEVAFEGLQGGWRLRHPARFVRWRPDKLPSECRYDQLEQIAPVELHTVFGV
jgi:ATP-dependent DNA ligase